MDKVTISRPEWKIWHGIPREKIPWYPAIDEGRCINCKLCFVSCGRNVFDLDEKGQVRVTLPYNCMVGCSTCATICPTGAISFPDREMIQKIEREYHIISYLPPKARAKKTRLQYEEARKKANEIIEKITTALKIEVTGHFLEKEVLKKILMAIRDKPCDLVNIAIEIPTLKGCWSEKAPSYARFVVVSTEFKDVGECVDTIKKVLEETSCVVISERKGT